MVDVVESLDLRCLTEVYGGGGKRPYHPAMMLSLLFFGYATGVFSSRKLERTTYETFAFQYITAGDHPDHDTIAAFRKRFLKELSALFLQMLTAAHIAGFSKFGTVSIDGTKVQANASKHKALSWAHALHLEGQLKAEFDILMRKSEEAAKEAATGCKSGARPPKEPEPGPQAKDQESLTDPESRIMPTAKGFEQAYNCQVAVDVDSHLIVTAHVTDACNDKQQLEPVADLLEASAETLGRPDAVLADSGYHIADNIELCEGCGMTPYILGQRERHNQPPASRLAVPGACPEDAAAVERAQHRLRPRRGKAVYAKRKSTVETVFRVVKEVLGFRRFHLRGLAASGEWMLVSLACNLKRMHVLSQGTI